MTLTEAAEKLYPIPQDASGAYRIAVVRLRKAYTAGYKDAMNDQIHLRNLEIKKHDE